jgi:hypothetical protein
MMASGQWRTALIVGHRAAPCLVTRRLSRLCFARRMGDLAKLDATMQLRWQTIESNAHTLEARRKATIVPAAYSPSTTGRRAVEMLARAPDGTLAGVNLEGTLGEGGMGIVRLGTQRALGRKVAVKTLRAEVHDEGAILKLLREAWITGALEHPNILPIHDLSLDDEGLPLVVLKLIEGSDWSEVISDADLAHERFDAEDLLEHNLKIFIQLCHAIAFAHSRGIVHRDIKPDNVRIGSFGEVYVLDWGIAVSLEDDGSGRFPLAKNANEMAGTPCYMAPEMLGEEDEPRISERTDIYLLGATLYEILKGDPPHLGKKAIQIVSSVLKSEPKLPEDAPEELVAIVERCMQREPEDRFESAEEVRVAVEEHLRHRGSIALAHTAADRLEELERVTGQSNDEGDTRLRAYDLFGECRFGFQQALEAWPGNELAADGLRLAAIAMAELELRFGDARTAARLVETLESVPAALNAKIEEGLREQEERERRMARLEALGKDHDPKVGTRTRMFVSSLFVLLWAVTPVVSALFAPRELRDSYTLTLSFAGVALLIALAVGYWARESMLKTVINRRVGGIALIMLVANLMAELGGLQMGLSAPDAEVFLFLLWSFTTAVLALTVDRRLMLAALMYLVGFFVASADVERRLWAMAVTNLIMAVTAFVVWRPAVLFAKRLPDGTYDESEPT